MLRKLSAFSKDFGVLLCLCQAAGLLLLVATTSKAQPTPPCRYKVHGFVKEGDQAVIGAKLTLLKAKISITSDPDGHFDFKGLCVGQDSLRIQALGYRTTEKVIFITQDAHLSIALTPLDAALHETKTVSITAASRKQTVINGTSLEYQDLEKRKGLSLGQMLADVPGVQILQTGPTLAKPMIRGLTGNRIAIINNGVRQEGQQWGSDHAPEIDPNTASKITVVKGPQALRFGTDAAGGAIIVSPAPLPTSPMLKASLTSTAASNNQMLGQSGSLEGAFTRWPALAWRVQGSYRNAGDAHSAHYSMQNTGFRENAFSATVGYQWHRAQTEVYYSRFQSQIGIFRHAHIGNVSDLLRILSHPDTVYTDPATRRIRRPFQSVSHDLIKAKHTWYNSFGDWEATASYQNDRRKEYDNNLRSAPNDRTPELDFLLQSYLYELTWQSKTDQYKEGKFAIGIGYGTQANQTLGRQLIPNFRNYQGHAFLSHSKTWLNALTWINGIRYDYRWMQVYRLTNGILDSPVFRFQGWAGSSQLVLPLPISMTWNLQASTSFRAPLANELFSNGLHHGTASYEIGDAQLKPERNYSLSSSLSKTHGRLQFQISPYATYYQDFIYLRPMNPEARLTIAGAFPLFNYSSTDVHMYGIDGHIRYDWQETWAITAKASSLRAWNATARQWLVFMPADQVSASVEWNKNINRRYKLHLSPNWRYVAFQSRTPALQDYAAAPPAYTLWGAQAQLSYLSNHGPFLLSISVSNLTNAAYRDYLNRMRYFTLDQGRNILVNLSLPLYFKKPTPQFVEIAS